MEEYKVDKSEVERLLLNKEQIEKLKKSKMQRFGKGEELNCRRIDQTRNFVLNGEIESFEDALEFIDHNDEYLGFGVSLKNSDGKSIIRTNEVREVKHIKGENNSFYFLSYPLTNIKDVEEMFEKSLSGQSEPGPLCKLLEKFEIFLSSLDYADSSEKISFAVKCNEMSFRYTHELNWIDYENNNNAVSIFASFPPQMRLVVSSQFREFFEGYNFAISFPRVIKKKEILPSKFILICTGDEEPVKFTEARNRAGFFIEGKTEIDGHIIYKCCK